MRFIALAVLVLFLAAGIVVGALNADAVGFDLGFTRIQAPKGAALLVVLLGGWLLGGLTAWVGLSLRRRHGAGRRSRDKAPDHA